MARQLAGLLTIRDAADVLDIDPFTVQLWIWRGRLRARKRARRWYIPAHELRRVLRTRQARPRGR